MSPVTVKVPKAPEPLACMRRSGITSRLRLASFSSSHTSSISSGPRGPAVLLFWLSTTGAPKAVVIGVTGASPWRWAGVVERSRWVCAASAADGACWYGQVGLLSLLMACSCNHLNGITDVCYRTVAPWPVEGQFNEYVRSIVFGYRKCCCLPPWPL